MMVAVAWVAVSFVGVDARRGKRARSDRAESKTVPAVPVRGNVHASTQQAHDGAQEGMESRGRVPSAAWDADVAQLTLLAYNFTWDSVVDQVAASSKGFYTSGNFLNTPMAAYVRTVPSGDLIGFIGDTEVLYEIYFYVRAAAQGYYAAAHRLEWMETNFNRISIFDTRAPNPPPMYGPTYNITFEDDYYGDGGFSADGTVFATLTETPDYYCQVTAFSTSNGSQLFQYTYPRNQWPYGDNDAIAVSANGSIIAAMTLNATGPKEQGAIGELYVFGWNGATHHATLPTTADLDPSWYEMVMTSDGQFIATLYDQLVVYERQPTNNGSLVYTVLFNYTLPADWPASFYSPLAVSPGAPMIAIGLFNNQTGSPNQYRVPRVQVFALPSSTPIFDYTWPAAPNNPYNDFTTGLAIDTLGEFLAVSTWGLDGNPAGHEQVQLFQLNSNTTNGPIAVYTTPGSMNSLDLARQDADGSLAIVAGGMHTHNNAGGGAGDLFLFGFKP